MAIFHHHKHEADEPPNDEQEADQLKNSDYDGETDLALPVHDSRPGDVFAPYAGSVVPAEPEAGYDIDRDTAP